MKVLLIHPDDGLLDGPWAACHWDRVIDLGRSGVEAYHRAAACFGCTVTTLDSFRNDFQEMRRVRSLLEMGFRRVVDHCDLDWWELTSVFVNQQLEVLILLNELAKTLAPSDEVHVSRSGQPAAALELILRSRVHVYPLQRRHGKGTARRYARVVSRFPMRQLWEIFWDKADPGYQFRGRFVARAKALKVPIVLLPTAYVNVSRTGVAYARSVPQTQFLLVATRPSGWLDERPSNVSMAWLRSYASVGATGRQGERADLMARWSALRTELEKVEEFRILVRIGGFGDFPERFTAGLEIRDAWRNVLDVQPVQAVICADDSNPYTNIPLLLAKQKGIPTIACHHGALDGRYLFKRAHADVILAKGDMEKDYLERVCGVPKGKVQIGAPPPPTQTSPGTDRHAGAKSFIVFFSETYETAGGRGRDFYLDVLPRLADLALAEGRKLVVKLHPFESLAERRRIAIDILRPEQRQAVRVLAGALEPGLLEKAWFAVTILSTVTVECAVRGIPCFLCRWLEFSPYGYVDQFSRFGLGLSLNRPEEIAGIPGKLAEHRASSGVIGDFWQLIATPHLQSLLGLPNDQFEPQPASITREEIS